MDCVIETPLDVLSRAATMLQNEERECPVSFLELFLTMDMHSMSMVICSLTIYCLTDSTFLLS